jgi:swainsonine biosynthesis oxidoreductase SwnR
MRVAIAGAGDLTRYLCDELPSLGHELILLSRRPKTGFDHPNVKLCVTDYSVPSLVGLLSECDVLISTILDYTSAFADVHFRLIEACRLSKRCRRFIPSEFSGNIERFPDQPAFYYRTREPVRQFLRQQVDLEWTLVCVGWLADYIAPSQNRYLSDMGEAFPINHTTRKITIPGTGDNAFDMIWARDMAKGIAALIAAPQWPEYVYMSGQRTTWNEVAAIVKQSCSDMTVMHKPVSDIQDDLKRAKSQDSQLLAEFQLFSASDASALPPADVQRQRQQLFSNVNFSALEDSLRLLKDEPDIII